MSHHQPGDRCRSRGDKTRQAGRLLAGAAGAFLVVGVAPLAAAPTAHADLDDFFQPIITTVDQAFSAVDPAAGLDDVASSALATSLADPLASLDNLLSGWYQSYIYDPVNDLEQWLFGSAALPGAAADTTTPALDTLTSASVPLTVSGGTEPVVQISVGGGPSTTVLVDTGSAGLVMPIWDINLFGITGLPTGMGLGAYSGGMDYVYVTLPTTISFGNDLSTGTEIITGPTAVNAVLFSFPTVPFGPWTINDFLAGYADGILGIGPNAVGPSPDYIPTEALPGSLGHGVLLDQSAGIMQFGDNPLTDGTTISGSPNTTLDVSINGDPVSAVRTIIDSGGVYGTIPSSALGGASSLPSGSVVTVYPHGGSTPLYSFTTTASASPAITSGGSMNTGNWLFQQTPVYISYAGNGATTFGGSYDAITPR